MTDPKNKPENVKTYKSANTEGKITEEAKNESEEVKKCNYVNKKREIYGEFTGLHRGCRRPTVPGKDRCNICIKKGPMTWDPKGWPIYYPKESNENSTVHGYLAWE